MKTKHICHVIGLLLAKVLSSHAQTPPTITQQPTNRTSSLGSSILKFTTALLLTVATTASAQTFTLLHSFASGAGPYPVGSLILSNATLYGMTLSGVFKMNTNGSGYTNLHSFGGFAGNAAGPHAALTLSGTNLYGMTVEGGAGVGVAFRVSTNGIGYTALHYFNSRETNGASPYGSLTLANGALYGTTHHGGTNNLGTLFRMDSDGGGYTSLHAFAGGTNDGANPFGDLTLSGTNFYGTTSQGGAAGLGVVFRMNTNGTGYTNLHSFTGYPNEGAGPPGSLTLDGSTLYGMTQEGGPNSARLGVVFKMNTDGSGYTNLHFFAGGTGDGATPMGSLTLANGWLYGMTSVGGASNKGTVFRVSTDGRSYTNFHSFAGGTNDGATAYGSLMLSGSTLYGVTYYGGTNNYGVVFTLSNLPPEPPTSLTIKYLNQQAIVSWPTSVLGWTLQTNNNLATGTWGNYSGPIISNTVTNSPTQGNLFFRLWHP
ncbi:MAG: hypothetical protein HY043_14290 [Verrucomicrobia bacterium]|nr:hypothetical protein [Verrucomicrobiota bacterium]